VGRPDGRQHLDSQGHTDEVNGVAFSPDSKRIVSAGFGFDRTVKVWDAETGRRIDSFKGHTKRVLCVAYSPDGERIVSGSNDGTLRVWKVMPLNRKPGQE
jgi:WD40 repeat protein